MGNGRGPIKLDPAGAPPRRVMLAGSAVHKALNRLLDVDPALAGLDCYGNGTLHLAPGRVTNPDVMVVETALLKGERAATPAITRLVVEVADTSLRYDEAIKTVLYAEAGVAEFWIVRVQDQALHVLRDPRGGVYADGRLLHRGGEIAPLFAPDHPLKVGPLIGAD